MSDVVRVNRFIKCRFERGETEVGECLSALENDRLHSWKKSNIERRTSKVEFE